MNCYIDKICPYCYSVERIYIPFQNTIEHLDKRIEHLDKRYICRKCEKHFEASDDDGESKKRLWHIIDIIHFSYKGYNSDFKIEIKCLGYMSNIIITVKNGKYYFDGIAYFQESLIDFIKHLPSDPKDFCYCNIKHLLQE